MLENNERPRPTLQDVLELKGYKMTPAPESTPHANTTTCSSSSEGTQQLPQYVPVDSVDTASRQTFAHLQTGLEIPLRSSGDYTPFVTTWPKIADAVEKDAGFACRVLREDEVDMLGSDAV